MTTPVGPPSAMIGIGGVTINIRTGDPVFLRLLEERYAGFTGAPEPPEFEFDIELTPPRDISAGADLRVFRRRGQWQLERGDFRAAWDPATCRGRVRQSANPYSIDTVLRIVHTLLLARQGGFLLHSASAVRNGRAFLFSGVSGAGKTTISRLAPQDVKLLTDEISYVRRDGGAYRAFGTPFAGELARSGENISAPIAALYFLAQGPENRIETIPPAEAGRTLLRNILFFAEDPNLVKLVFDAACGFVSKVPVYRLTFVPDPRVWDWIV